MDDGKKQTINHVYHTLRDMLSKTMTNLDTATNIKHMLWYLETNFPKDMLKHEMGDRHSLYPPWEDQDAIWHEEQLRAFENEGGTYSEKMQDNLEPIDDSIVMVSCCCAVEILDGDICSDCKEHCEPIPEGDGES